ncbi:MULTISPECIES: HutD family protein [Kordiimonas]|jgi:hypothetical protein|uniref:HutD/Ves family protein n=1 Tax=Kordiimonas TaxID=288021 RepID=UPI00257A6082|nr:HutD family protein [Kordiimonas sp. UBA4487]
MKVLGVDDYQVQPWKNGLGSTTELAVGPKAAGGAGFIWRLSIAEVTTDGAFSLFPDIDRVITVIDGAGMTLDAGPYGNHPLKPFTPLQFSGDWHIEGRLKAGPVRNFNLMVDRRYAKGTMAFHDFATGAVVLSNKNALRFFYLLEGEVRCGEAMLTPGQTLLLEAGESAPGLNGVGAALHGEITLRP